MRARLQRGGTEPSVTPLSLARVSSFSHAQRGETPLYIAACEGKTECVQLLIDAGADLNATPKARAALSSRFPARESRPLTRRSPSRAQNGQTVLWIAAYCGKTDCVRRLVAAGANKDIADKNGRKPIYVVCAHISNKANKAEIEALLR